jgi:hypothetical protein
MTSQSNRRSVLLLACLSATPVYALGADELTRPLEELRLFFAPEVRVKPVVTPPTAAELGRKLSTVPVPQAASETDIKKGYAIVKGAGGVQTIVDDVPQPRIQ